VPRVARDGTRRCLTNSLVSAIPAISAFDRDP